MPGIAPSQLTGIALKPAAQFADQSSPRPTSHSARVTGTRPEFQSFNATAALDWWRTRVFHSVTSAMRSPFLARTTSPLTAWPLRHSIDPRSIASRDATKAIGELMPAGAKLLPKLVNGGDLDSLTGRAALAYPSQNTLNPRLRSAGKIVEGLPRCGPWSTRHANRSERGAKDSLLKQLSLSMAFGVLSHLLFKPRG